MTSLQSSFLFSQRKFEWQPVLFPEIDQVNEVGKPRVYRTPDGKTFESVSNFLRRHSNTKWVEEWRAKVGDAKADEVSKKATDRGTLLHAHLEAYIQNKDPKERSVLFPQLKTLIDMNVGVIYAQECKVYSERLKIAGTLDLFAQWKKKASIIDWKSSTRVKKEEDAHGYLLQGTLYSVMVQELTGIVADQIVVVIANEKSPKPTIIVKNRKKYFEEIMDLVRKDRGIATKTKTLF